MKFNIGDKVSFLNEKLSGKITRIINEELCKVEIDDGFEIDARAKELVLISKAEASEIPSAKDVIEPLLEKITVTATSLSTFFDDGSLFFVSAPAEDLQVLSGPVNFYLVNKTNYTALYSFSAKIKNKTIGIISGTLKPKEEILLSTKKRPDLIDWQNLLVQAVLFSKDEYEPTTPLHREFSLLLPDLKVEFTTAKGTLAYSKFLKLFTEGIQQEINLDELKKKFSDEPVSEVQTKNIPQRKIPASKPDDSLYGILRNENEVDLHIQHLVSDYKNLSNSEMLQLQLKKFRKEMDHALKNHYHKLIFIHGVGNGVLRTEIQRELRSYDNIRFADASFDKYGYGATEVVFL